MKIWEEEHLIHETQTHSRQKLIQDLFALHILNVVRHLFVLTMVINEHKDQDVISDYRGGNYGQRCPWRTSALFLSFLGAKSYNYVINPLYSCSPVYFHLIGSRDYHMYTSVYNIIVIC